MLTRYVTTCASHAATHDARGFRRANQADECKGWPRIKVYQGRKKVIGGDREKTSSKRTSIFPDPPIFDLTFWREGKIKQEESCKGAVGQGPKCT